MESFLGLFDPGEGKQKAKERWDRFETEGHGSSDCESSSNDEDQEQINSDGEERLPPEPEQGNIEYKLKLVNPSSQRFEHLVTQMKWRLREGHGEAIYQIGTRYRNLKLFYFAIFYPKHNLTRLNFHNKLIFFFLNRSRR